MGMVMGSGIAETFESLGHLVSVQPSTMILRHHFRHTFGHVVAAIYTAGTIFHIVRLSIRLGWEEMPYLPDWILVLLGSYAAVGLIVFASEVEFRGTWERVVHWLIVSHLLISVALHAWMLVAHSHEPLAIFSLVYSYFGAVYFAFFAWRSWTMRLRYVAPPPPVA